MCTIATLKADLNCLGVYEHVNEAVLIYLAATSRLMQHKLSVVSVGSSSIGKSFTQNAALALIPPDSVMTVAGMTIAALLRTGDLSDKIVNLNEHCGDDNFESMLRQLISEGLVRFDLVESGQRVSREVKGPTVVLDTTIDAAQIDHQNRNRALVLNFRLTASELDAQAKRIKHRRTQDGIAIAAAAKEVIARHHEFQRNLQPGLRVFIPFAESIEFAVVEPHHKRLLENFLTVIEAIAFLDQGSRVKQKGSDGVDSIETTIADFENALAFFHDARIETGTEHLSDDACWLLSELVKRPELFCSESAFSLKIALDNINPIYHSRTESTVQRTVSARQARQLLEVLRSNELITRSRGPHNIALYNIVPEARSLSAEDLRCCLTTLRLRSVRRAMQSSSILLIFAKAKKIGCR